MESIGFSLAAAREDSEAEEMLFVCPSRIMSNVEQDVERSGNGSRITDICDGTGLVQSYHDIMKATATQGKRTSKPALTAVSKIRRPPNAFMIFANEHRKLLARAFPSENNQAISVRLGSMWKAMVTDHKSIYYKMAREAAAEHKRLYPAYVYSPKEARMRKQARELVRREKVPKPVFYSLDPESGVVIGEQARPSTETQAKLHEVAQLLDCLSTDRTPKKSRQASVKSGHRQGETRPQMTDGKSVKTRSSHHPAAASRGERYLMQLDATASPPRLQSTVMSAATAGGSDRESAQAATGTAERDTQQAETDLSGHIRHEPSNQGHPCEHGQLIQQQHQCNGHSRRADVHCGNYRAEAHSVQLNVPHGQVSMPASGAGYPLITNSEQLRPSIAADISGGTHVPVMYGGSHVHMTPHVNVHKVACGCASSVDCLCHGCHAGYRQCGGPVSAAPGGHCSALKQHHQQQQQQNWLPSGGLMPAPASLAVGHQSVGCCQQNATPCSVVMAPLSNRTAAAGAVPGFALPNATGACCQRSAATATSAAAPRCSSVPLCWQQQRPTAAAGFPAAALQCPHSGPTAPSAMPLVTAASAGDAHQRCTSAAASLVPFSPMVYPPPRPLCTRSGWGEERRQEVPAVASLSWSSPAKQMECSPHMIEDLLGHDVGQLRM